MKESTDKNINNSSTFETLVNKRLPELVKNLSGETDDYCINFEYMGYDSACNRYYDNDYCTPVGVLVSIEDKESGEKVSGTLDILKMPVPGELGFKLGKSIKQILKVDKRASGWFILEPKKSEDEGGAKEKETLATMEYNSNFKSKIYFMSEDGQIYFSSSKDGKGKKSVGILLKAITRKSYAQLINMLGTNKYLLNSFKNELSVETSIMQAGGVILPTKISSQKDITRVHSALINRMFAEDIVGSDGAGAYRYEINSSFLKRCFNKTLAQDVKIDNEIIKAGTTLSTEQLIRIDESGIDTLFVKYNDKKYCNKKFTGSNCSLTAEEILTMINMYANTLDGYGIYDDQYDTSSRVILSYEDSVLNKVVFNLDRVKGGLLNELPEGGSGDEDLRVALAKVGDGIELDILLEELKSPENTYVQQASNTNLLKLSAMNNKITADYSGKASEDAIKVQDRERGRTDQIDQPESNKIGKVHYETILTKKDKYGFQTAPYLKVENGKVVSNNFVYLTADEEEKYYIASHDETFENEKVRCYFNGIILNAPKELISYKEVSSIQSMSISRAFIVFQEFSNPKRLLMGGNHLKQAIYTMRTERPLVSTGSFSISPEGIVRAKDILGEYYDANESVINSSREAFVELPLQLIDTRIKKSLRYLSFNVHGHNILINKGFAFMQPTDAKTVFTNQIVPRKGNIYKGNDIVVHNANVDIRPKTLNMCVDYGAVEVDNYDEDFSLGVNLLIGFKTFEGSTIEDAITIRKGKCYDGSLTSISIKEISMETFTDRKTFEEFFGTNGCKSDDHIGSNGLPTIGTYLKPGSVVMHKYRKYSDGRIAPLPFMLDNNTSGEVINAEIIDREAVVTLASIDAAEVGDKMSGRYGNKGVIAKVVDDVDMPYIKDTGEILDVILNPLGIPSRMNISQVLEINLGMALSNKTKQEIEGQVRRIREEHLNAAVVSPFHRQSKEYVQEMRKKYNVKPQILIDGRTGEAFKRPVEVGIMYMLKLEHLAKKKIASVNKTHNLNPVTGQPQQGSGGQAVGEMETWVLGVEGCDNFLQEILSSQSDDIEALEELEGIIESNPKEVEIDGDNSNNVSLQAILMCLGVSLKNNDNGDYIWEPLKDLDIKELASRPLDTASIDTLNDEEIFGKKNSHKKIRHKNKGRFGYISLECEIVNPFWVNNSDILHDIPVYYVEPQKTTDKKKTKNTLARTKTLGKKNIAEVLDGSVTVGTVLTDGICTLYSAGTSPEQYVTGVEGLLFILKNTTLLGASKFIKENWKDLEGERKSHLESIGRLERWNEDGMELSDIIISHYPILSPVYRPSMAERNQAHDLEYYYKGIFDSIENFKKNKSAEGRLRIFNAISRFIGIQTSSDEAKSPLLKTYMGRDKEGKGDFRTKLLGKRVHFSGRSVIVPSQDTTMEIDTIGVPILMGVNIWNYHLRAMLRKLPLMQEILPDITKVDSTFFSKLLTFIASDNVFKFYQSLVKEGYQGDLTSSKEIFFKVAQEVISFLEKQYVVSGRQPSLHKFGSRAYKVRITQNRAIEVHPLVCKGYNADFDGDTMYLIAVLSEKSREEVSEKLTPKKSIINPKDGSAIVEHSQDICLGIYFATMLHNNVTSLSQDARYENIYHTKDLESLKTMVESGMIEPQDLATINHEGRKYLATAGRILFNSLIPDGLTYKAFTNTLNIPNIAKKERYCELRFDALIGKGSGKVLDVQYQSLSKLTTGIFEDYDIDTTMQMFQDTMEFGFKYSDMSGITLGMDDIILGEDAKAAVLEQDQTKLKKEQLTVINNELDAFEDDLRRMDLSSNEISCKVKSREAELKTNAKEVLDVQKEDLKSKYKNGKIAYLKDRFRILEEEINEATLKGLISEEGRKKLLVENATQLSEKIGNELKTMLPRNNNLFIIKDSGARGNDGQIAQTLGLGGISMKTLTTSIEVPILNSYADGLTSFEMDIASHGARQGVASTQLGTADAGYATRQMVNMIGGIEVKDCSREDEKGNHIEGSEHDCGAKPINLPLEYGEPYKITFKGTMKRIPNYINSRGRKVRDTSKVEEVYVEDAFELEASGLKAILNGKLVVDDSDEITKYLQNFLGANGELDSEAVKMLFKKKIRRVICKDGEYRIHYKLDELFESLLGGRRTDEFPFLNHNGYVNKAILNHIKEENPTHINVRLSLNCRAESGVCQHCFGIKYDRPELPFIGERVGIESAQAIGEPSAQLVMSLFHKGGRAGDSVSSGVKLNNSVLKGTLPLKDRKAIHAPTSGYVTVNTIGNDVVIELNGDTYKCPSTVLAVSNGEYVERFSQLTEGLPLFNTLGVEGPEHKEKRTTLILEKNDECYMVKPGNKNSISLSSSFSGDVAEIMQAEDSKEVVIPIGNFQLKRQLVLMDLYYRTFRQNNMSLHARHFELLVRVQTLGIHVFNTNIPGIIPGDLVEYTRVKCNLEDVNNMFIVYPISVAKQGEVVRLFGGQLAALGFERGLDQIGEAVSARQVIKEKGLLGKIFIGENVSKKEPKKLPTFAPQKSKRRFDKPAEVLDVTEFEVLEYEEFDTTQDLQLNDLELDFSLEEFKLDLPFEPSEDYKNESVENDTTTSHSTKKLNLFGGEE